MNYSHTENKLNIKVNFSQCKTNKITNNSTSKKSFYLKRKSEK